MSTASELEAKIRKCQHNDLQKLWSDHVQDNFDYEFWAQGKLLEYVVLRGFELEIESEKYEDYDGSVTYPYTVQDKEQGINVVEQIDGAVHFDGLHALVECKDYSSAKVKVEPLAKMRNQLARRHSTVFGMFFTATNLTEAAKYLVRFMAPQLIIIWSKRDIECCINHECFIECMIKKYRMAIENCVYNYDFSIEKEGLETYFTESLF